MQTFDYEIDRMINEGLGGGFILYNYDKGKLSLIKADEEENDNDDPIRNH